MSIIATYVDPLNDPEASPEDKIEALISSLGYGYLTPAQKSEIIKRTLLLITSVVKRNSKPQQTFFDLFIDSDAFDYVVNHLIRKKYFKDISEPYMNPYAAELEYLRTQGQFHSFDEPYIIRQLQWVYKNPAITKTEINRELAEVIKELHILGYFKPTIKLTDKKISRVIEISFQLEVKVDSIKKTRTNPEIKANPTLGLKSY